MKKFNAFSVYTLGKELFELLKLEDKDYKLGIVLWPLWSARMTLLQQFQEESIFLDASKRAALAVIQNIDSVIPRDLKEAFAKDKDEIVYGYQINWIKNAVQTLETVMTNDMPGLSSYMVNQKGIYKTDDLIERADAHFHEEIRPHIPDRAKEDFKEAGKCLAYEVPTACAFHLWRSVETVAEAYYQKLTTKTFEQAGVQRNWGAYIKALAAAQADSKITQFLDHIREKYRNPQMHPDEMVSDQQAFGLFGAASSVITQIVLEIQKPAQQQLTLGQVAQAGKPAAGGNP